MRPEPDNRRVALAATLGGLLLGCLDFIWIKYVPYPVGNLGNSSAVWAVAAYLFGFWVRSGKLRAAAGAAVALVVAVPGYYATAALVQGDDWAVLWATTSLLWMCFGVLAGVIFGIAGTWTHGAGWRQVVGPALPAAVLFAEAGLEIRRIGDPSYGNDPIWDALIRIALGLLVLALAGRTNRQRALALVAALPLALAGLAAFLIAGFR
ncbi:DUF6518 family protein [Micromonospora sediminimaris]|uniref:Uncharacterized protein n=1 Tax=Micromonospora sediminimaris TaxID=547162 RepID=A0A9W5UUT7_9ACTN|nr:DUF6518 family protein [Micromonospora sediminimaris]GIJ34613.1 hypothetical protein Vse01_37610 [Micromonospora sediminimaris]SFD41668.1 hypothetical protein SAMN05216284_116125 [Micromonospora sediminimaris]